MLFLVGLIITILWIVSSASQYHLYYSNRLNTSEVYLYYDCLYYHVRNDIVKYKSQSRYAYQIIPYCIRPSEPELLHVKHDTLVLEGRPITFKELHASMISSQQLVTWFASIDVAERYQADDGFGSGLYYNCTWPAFGDYCQYSLHPPKKSFGDVVRNIFESKIDQRDIIADYTSYSCYTHMTCSRGPEPICLDWREICDNHIDCLSGGEDEENCILLELNECTEDEFRCRNGMCIPDDFLHDDELNPDCLDGTDEYQALLESSECYKDPAFRCSELSPPYDLGFSCGDDTYRSKYILPFFVETCKTGRDAVFSRIIWSYANHNTSLSLLCWSAMVCLHNLNLIDGLDCDDYCNFYRCLKIARGNCPPLFVFPNYHILGHIHLLYSSNISVLISVPIPNYVCFNYKLCDFLEPKEFLNNLTCVKFETFAFNEDVVLDWDSILSILRAVFRGCSSTYPVNHQQLCRAKNVFHCQNSSKCISKHRLIDGFKDCYEDIDEAVTNSYDLEKKYRFQCSSENKSVPLWSILNGIRDCNDGEDELEFKQHGRRVPVAFTNICDGFTEAVITTDDGLTETDETNCDQWQCDNHYTHCNRVWNCANGIDEVACRESPCPLNEHRCISSKTYKPICLSLNQTGNGEIDCLGSYDERSYCRERHPLTPEARYRCQHDSECAPADLVCRMPNYCPHEDRQGICPNMYAYREIFVKLFDKDRSKTYFSLPNSKASGENLRINFDDSFISNPSDISNDKSIGSKTMQGSVDENSRQSWLCNRGIPIYNNVRHDDDCLCPPSHYGNRCQYQNQRVSLTIRFDKENAPQLWHASFYFSIMLLDEEQYVHSYDYITYVPTRDCANKYNFNLFYNERPKDVKKNYSVHIDAFIIEPLAYYTSWYLSIPFQFLPVNRLGFVWKCHHHSLVFDLWYVGTLL